ncbi:MAG: hypothetical protein MZU79_06500 [Anaerotruncus sp.]|nr:hypothetical protein [Anaerotruncus sp.]
MTTSGTVAADPDSADRDAVEDLRLVREGLPLLREDERKPGPEDRRLREPVPRREAEARSIVPGPVLRLRQADQRTLRSRGRFRMSANAVWRRRPGSSSIGT